VEILRPRGLLVAIAVVAVAITLAVALAPGPLYERRGTVAVPYDARDVYEVRLLGAVTVYVDGKLYGDGEPRINANLIGSIALLMLGVAALTIAIALRIGGAGRRLTTFYLIAGAGLGLAGLDKLLAIHETVGHNLRFLADVPGVERPDDLIVALYLVPVLAVGYRFRDGLAGDRYAAAALAVGVAFFALSACADLASWSAEKHLELISGLFIAGGMMKLIHHHLTRTLPPQIQVTRRPRMEVGEQVPGERPPTGAVQ